MSSPVGEIAGAVENNPGLVLAGTTEKATPSGPTRRRGPWTDGSRPAGNGLGPNILQHHLIGALGEGGRIVNWQSPSMVKLWVGEVLSVGGGRQIPSRRGRCRPKWSRRHRQRGCR